MPKVTCWKKNQTVCKYCWAHADPEQFVLAKFKEKYCLHAGCWKWCMEGKRLCKAHITIGDQTNEQMWFSQRAIAALGNGTVNEEAKEEHKNI